MFQMVIMAGIALSAAVATPPGSAPATSPTSQPATRPASQPGLSASDVQIRSILERMEAMGDRVDDLRCRVEYTVEDLIGLSAFTKFGLILYKRTEPNATFFITFDKMHEGGIVSRKKEWYLFEDRWLSEAKEVSKTVIRREVIGKDETVDLFSLEQAPFPIPFGQRKDEILRHFRVTLSAAEESDPRNTDHLVCVPRPGSRLGDTYSRLEFFVSRALDLPVKIVAFEADPDGEPAKIITALFPDLTRKSVNSGVPAEAFRLPAETKRYQLVEEPLEEPVRPVPGHGQS